MNNHEYQNGDKTQIESFPEKIQAIYFLSLTLKKKTKFVF